MRTPTPNDAGAMSGGRCSWQRTGIASRALWAARSRRPLRSVRLTHSPDTSSFCRSNTVPSSLPAMRLQWTSGRMRAANGPSRGSSPRCRCRAPSRMRCVTSPPCRRAASLSLSGRSRAKRRSSSGYERASSSRALRRRCGPAPRSSRPRRPRRAPSSTQSLRRTATRSRARWASVARMSSMQVQPSPRDATFARPFAWRRA